MNSDDVRAKLEKLKQEDPVKYLACLEELNQIVSDLNKELRDAKAGLK